MHPRVAVVVLAVVLAGCASPGPSLPHVGEDPAAGSPGSNAVAAAPVSGLNSSSGSAEGRVRDRHDHGLEGALVLLAGVQDRATTNSDGSFHFPSLDPGRYVLQVRLVGYVPTGTPIEIRAGSITRIDVMLTVDVANATATPVDFWEGRDRVQVADAMFSGDDTAYAGQCKTGAKSVWGGMPKLRFDDPYQLVWPGTASIEVVLDWDSSSFLGDQVLIAWREHPDAAFRLTDLTTKGTVMVLDVGPEMADRVHQRFTAWEFNVCSKDESGGVDQYAKRFDGSLHAVMTLVRGHPLPLAEPPADLWGGSDRILLIDDRLDVALADPIDSPLFAVFAPCNGVVARDFALPGFEKAFAESWRFPVPEGLIVPPGTSRIVARLEWSYGDLTHEPVDLFLSFRGANIPPWEPIDPARETVPDHVEQGSAVRGYDFPVESTWTDGADDVSSAWSFFWNLDGPTPICDSLSVHLVVEAVRSAATASA